MKMYPAVSRIQKWRKESALPPSIQLLCIDILERGTDDRELREAWSELPLHNYRAIAADISQIIRLLKQYEAPPLRKRAWLFTASKRVPQVSWLNLFDFNGYQRQGALEQVRGPLHSAFELVALIDQMNNWVGPVREAAGGALRRCLPSVPVELLAQAAAYLLPQIESWRRWDVSTAEGVRALLTAQPIIENMVETVCSPTTVRSARLVRSLLKEDKADRYLERLASHAYDPSVRALVLRALIEREVRWIVSYRYQWIDKTLGLRRLVPEYAARPLSVAPSREDLIVCALKDRAAAVRASAVDGLIAHRGALDLALVAIAVKLGVDKSARVRSRADFLMRQL